MTINPVQFDKFALPLNKVLARLGYAGGKTKLDSKINDILREEIETAQKLLSPKQVEAFGALSFAGAKGVNIEPSYIIGSRDIIKLLKGCGLAAGFAVTIGPALEQKRDQCLKDKETTRALVLDAAGSVAVEELAGITNRQIERLYAEKGYAATRRFSPGYGDWNVSGQKDLLDWLGAGQIGIKLTDAFEMLPEKSVSAILGLKKQRLAARDP
jgi:hypothetical protein